MKKIKKTSVLGALAKAGCFAFLIMTVLLLNSTCKNPRYLHGYIKNICDYRTPIIFLLSILVIGLYTAGVVFFRVKAVKAELAKQGIKPENLQAKKSN